MLKLGVLFAIAAFSFAAAGPIKPPDDVAFLSAVSGRASSIRTFSSHETDPLGMKSDNNFHEAVLPAGVQAGLIGLLEKDKQRGRTVLTRREDSVEINAEREAGEFVHSHPVPHVGSEPRIRDLRARRIGNSQQPSQQHPSQQPQQQQWLTRNQVLADLEMTPSEPGAHAIADFLRRRQLLIASINIERTQRQWMTEMYRLYQQRHPTRGSAVNYDNSAALMHEMTFRSGRDRFRDIQPIIDHLLQNERVFGLSGARAAYLEALRSRFQHTEVDMTPTVDELIEIGPAAEMYERIRRWVNNDFGMEEPAVRDHLRARMRRVVHDPLQFIQDFHLLQHVENELDGFVDRVDQAATAARAARVVPQLKKRNLEWQFPSQKGPAKSRKIVLIPRSSDSDRPATLTETMQSLGLGAGDTGAEPIARFWQEDRQLFPPAAPSQATLIDLRNIYRQYQLAHPVRGRAVDIRDDDVLAHLVTEQAGRNRFRDIGRVVRYLTDNANQLGLDQLRVRYLNALQARFEHVHRILTPTPDEIVDRGLERVRAVQPQRTMIYDMGAIVNRVLAFLEVRANLANANFMRVALDSTLLSHLEENLDRLVLDAEARVADRTRVLRRDIQQNEPEGVIEHHEPSSEAITKGTIFETGDAKRRLQPRRVASSTEDGVESSTSEYSAQAQTDRNAPSPDSRRGHLNIERFLRREESLIPLIDRAPNHRQELVNLYRGYQGVVTPRGQDLSLENVRQLVRLMLHDMGRDRFQRMEPILSHLMAQREALQRDQRRLDLVKDLHDRFRETQALMSPTLDDLAREKQRATNGARSDHDSQVTLQTIAKATAERSHRAMIKANRFLEDLKLIKFLEEELEDISGPVQSTREASRHLVKRDDKFLASGSEPASQSTAQFTDADRRFILSPLGMSLRDAHARQIAAWRLHEASLLQDRSIPEDLQKSLRDKWLLYRAKFPNLSARSRASSWPTSLHAFIYADEGARFTRANEIIT